MEYYQKLIESIQSSLQEWITKKREYKGIEIDSVRLPILTYHHILHNELDDLLSGDIFKLDIILGEVTIFATKNKGNQKEKVFLKDIHGQWDRKLKTFNIIDFEVI